jgi:hypothetical protein
MGYIYISSSSLHIERALSQVKKRQALRNTAFQQVTEKPSSDSSLRMGLGGSKSVLLLPVDDTLLVSMAAMLLKFSFFSRLWQSVESSEIRVN